MKPRLSIAVKQNRAGKFYLELRHGNGKKFNDQYGRKRDAKRAAIKFVATIKGESFCEILDCN